MAPLDGASAYQMAGVSLHVQDQFMESNLLPTERKAIKRVSLLHFFIHLFEYWNTPHDTFGVIVRDNLSLINKVIAFQSPFPTAALLDDYWAPFDSLPTLLSNTSPAAIPAPDWDVLNEIRHSLHELNFCPTFQHIKGHQDCDTPYKNLPLLAQLNVDADTAAGDFQSQHGCHRPHVPLLPHAGARLQIDDATITYKHKSFIWNAAYGPPLLQYIQQRNQWNPAIMQYIDWDAHGLAIRRLFHLRVHLTKLIHDILPTNDNVSRWKPNRTEKWPSCPHPKEDRDHVLRYIQLAWTGAKSFLYLSVSPATNSIPNPISK
jgi:hypothetical protein